MSTRRLRCTHVMLRGSSVPASIAQMQRTGYTDIETIEPKPDDPHPRWAVIGWRLSRARNWTRDNA